MSQGECAVWVINVESKFIKNTTIHHHLCIVLFCWHITHILVPQFRYRNSDWFTFAQWLPTVPTRQTTSFSATQMNELYPLMHDILLKWSLQFHLSKILNDQHWYVSHPLWGPRGHVTWASSPRLSGSDWKDLWSPFIKQTFGNLLQWRLPYGKVLLINHKSITQSLFITFSFKTWTNRLLYGRKVRANWGTSFIQKREAKITLTDVPWAASR